MSKKRSMRRRTGNTDVAKKENKKVTKKKVEGTEVKLGKEIFDVRGESIEVESKLRYDKETGERVEDKKLDSIAEQKSEKEYQKKYLGFDGEAIKDLRGKYDMTQKMMADLVDLSVGTISRYEVDNLPSEDNEEDFKRLMGGEDSFKDFYEENKGKLSEDFQKRIQKQLDLLKEVVEEPEVEVEVIEVEVEVIEVIEEVEELEEVEEDEPEVVEVEELEEVVEDEPEVDEVDEVEELEEVVEDEPEVDEVEELEEVEEDEPEEIEVIEVVEEPEKVEESEVVEDETKEEIEELEEVEEPEMEEESEVVEDETKEDETKEDETKEESIGILGVLDGLEGDKEDTKKEHHVDLQGALDGLSKKIAEDNREVGLEDFLEEEVEVSLVDEFKVEELEETEEKHDKVKLRDKEDTKEEEDVKGYESGKVKDVSGDILEEFDGFEGYEEEELVEEELVEEELVEEELVEEEFLQTKSDFELEGENLISNLDYTLGEVMKEKEVNNLKREFAKKEEVIKKKIQEKISKQRKVESEGDREEMEKRAEYEKITKKEERRKNRKGLFGRFK